MGTKVIDLNRKLISVILLISFLLTFYSVSMAQSADQLELAKKLANPIANLISVPFQNNTDYGIGDLKGSRNVLNFQPVIPLRINDKINLITRAVIPIISQYNITEPSNGQTGLGNTIVSGFFSPSEAKNGLTWGVGPALNLPTSTNTVFGPSEFGFGPTAIALKQGNGWTVGGLVNQIWGGQNSEGSGISQMFIQPFVVYNWGSGAGVGANSEIVQDWKRNKNVTFLNPNVSGITSLGKQKVQLVLGPRIPIAAPIQERAGWGWRAVLIFLFPK